MGLFFRRVVFYCCLWRWIRSGLLWLQMVFGSICLGQNQSGLFSDRLLGFHPELLFLAAKLPVSFSAKLILALVFVVITFIENRLKIFFYLRYRILIDYQVLSTLTIVLSFGPSQATISAFPRDQGRLM